jgi:hypothetical protein
MKMVILLECGNALPVFLWLGKAYSAGMCGISAVECRLWLLSGFLPNIDGHPVDLRGAWA